MIFSTTHRLVYVADAGTRNTAIANSHRGLLLREPTLAAVPLTRPGTPVPPASLLAQQVRAVGLDCLDPGILQNKRLKLVEPMLGGGISDPIMLDAVLNGLLHKVKARNWRSRLFGSTFHLILPPGLDEDGRSTYAELIGGLGFGRAELLEAPFCAAAGCGWDIEEPRGRLLIQIGAGRVYTAGFSLGGVAAFSAAGAGSRDLDRAIADYVARRHHLRIDLGLAEWIKHEIGSVYPLDSPKSAEIRGIDAQTGIEKNITLNDNEIRDVLIDSCEPWVLAIHRGMETLLPELAGDIGQSGAVLLGGGALLSGLPAFLKERIGISFHLASDPINTTVRGALRLLQQGRGTHPSPVI